MSDHSTSQSELDQLRQSPEARAYIAGCMQFDETVRLILLRKHGVLTLPLQVKAPYGQAGRLEALWGSLRNSGGQMTADDVKFLDLLAKGMVRRFESAMSEINEEDAEKTGIPWKLSSIERDTCIEMAKYFMHMGLHHLVLGGLEEDFFQVHVNELTPGGE